MDIKSFLHAWCNKQGKVPNYDIMPCGTKRKPRFFCRLKVNGIPYTGSGNSTSKKESQLNAIRDLVQYLARQNLIQGYEIPKDMIWTNGLEKNQRSHMGGKVSAQGNPVFQQGMEPNLMGEAYRPYREGENNESYTYIDRLAEQRNVSNAEENDISTSLHGNWTLENAKSRLHQFMQKNKINTTYKYSIVGGELSRTFVAEMSIYVQQLQRTLTGRKSGLSKASASKSCALSLVRQLYHLGVIEAFSGSQKKVKEQLPEYAVAVSPMLEEEIYKVLNIFKITPVPISEVQNSQKGISIINSTVLDEFISSNQQQSAGVVEWAPPLRNWNPWTVCNIDEGPLANVSLEDISQYLKESFNKKLQEDVNLQNLIKERNILPAAQVKEQILKSIHENSVIIIQGSTGCGKTTQICQYILDDYIQSGRGAYCNIIVTQPRRLSATSLSERVAHERSETLGQSCGYAIRFESCYPRPYGSILFCTIGVLLRKLENGLKGVSHVIVDEIHERNVNTDFILVILRDMIYTYPDLKVIMMSATINTALFSAYFGNCPVFEIPGKLYPVKEFFLEDCVEMLKFVPVVPPKKKKKKKSVSKHFDDDDEEDDEVLATQNENEEEENLNLVISDEYNEETREAMSKIPEKEICFELIGELLNYVKQVGIPGAVLVFLPGWNVIVSLMKQLLQHPVFGSSSYKIFPLHSHLPREDQKRVFEIFPPSITKVILATNIAETSITINDVAFVIDSCRSKSKIFTSYNNTTHYSTVWSSKTNAEQRKGRAGRVRPGMCFYLCSKARFAKLDDHITPEIFRTPLHELALAIKTLRLGAIGQFLSKVVEPPPIDAVIEAEVLLREIKCLDSKDELTPLGRILGRLPIDPRLGKMIVTGCLFNCGNTLTTIAACVTTFLEVFSLDMERLRAVDTKKSCEDCRYSDHLAMYNIFQDWQKVRMQGVQQEERFCDERMLSMPSIRTTWEARNQLVQLLNVASGFPDESVAPTLRDLYSSDLEPDLVVALLTMGLYPSVGYHKSRRKILTTGCKPARIHRTSINHSVHELPIPFFVYGEKIRTKTVACKQLSMVTPIHLLLFGSRKVEYIDNIIKLDGWINLAIKPELASAICALRPALESLVAKVSTKPQLVNELSEIDNMVLNLIRNLCTLNAGRYGLKPVEFRMRLNKSVPKSPSFGPVPGPSPAFNLPKFATPDNSGYNHSASVEYRGQKSKRVFRNHRGRGYSNSFRSNFKLNGRRGKYFNFFSPY